MKTKQISERGFTLIELLTTVAIIGILASTIFVSLSGQRDRAKLASAMESGRSVIPSAVDCFMTNKQLTAWTSASTGGNAICAGSTGVWPSLGDTDCVYENLDDTSAATGNKRWRINCDSGSSFVSCFAKDGNCCKSDASYVCN
ncbi:type II secretion system protein [bacterium]|jgi:prepilin-type N-terminal cleavage/methylation domain-containing protein|nr:type II secretion system protein [bacterium]MBT4250741.1 type II secretion system protein [bacterium]MBT4598176.1 type II secretion system protein [bacterium]MBT6753774.1 type II secretion system protein [bacterium]MBT7037513.1 type II secretion system protein [bacterium]